MSNQPLGMAKSKEVWPVCIKHLAKERTHQFCYLVTGLACCKYNRLVPYPIISSSAFKDRVVDVSDNKVDIRPDLFTKSLPEDNPTEQEDELWRR